MKPAQQPFSLTHDTARTPEDTWARLTDWSAHAQFVPLTTIEITTAGPTGAGTMFNARTGVGRVGFDDPMEIVEWDPPTADKAGRCRLEKRGSFMVGWAELTVEPRGSGARATWTEAARPARAPRFADKVSDALGRKLFGRVLRGLLAESA
ncbi:MAG: SRPBCC family protein [Jatrophihabitans sp.]